MIYINKEGKNKNNKNTTCGSPAGVCLFVCFFVLNAFLNNCWISIIGTAKHDCLFVRASSQLQAATARNTSLQIKL